MGLLPIIGKALGLFSFLSVTALAVSFILYKLRSPRNKPYSRTTHRPYQQQNFRPAFQASYYQAPEMAPVKQQMAPIPETVYVNERENFNERMDFHERRYVQERLDYSERNVPERRHSQQKVNARPRSKFQVLHSTEDGEITAYHLPTRDY